MLRRTNADVSCCEAGVAHPANQCRPRCPHISLAVVNIIDIASVQPLQICPKHSETKVQWRQCSTMQNINWFISMCIIIVNWKDNLTWGPKCKSKPNTKDHYFLWDITDGNGVGFIFLSKWLLSILVAVRPEWMFLSLPGSLVLHYDIITPQWTITLLQSMLRIVGTLGV